MDDVTRDQFAWVGQCERMMKAAARHESAGKVAERNAELIRAAKLAETNGRGDLAGYYRQWANEKIRDPREPGQEITLLASNGDPLRITRIPPFRIPPDAIVWGPRIFVPDPTHERWTYREAFAYHLAPGTWPRDTLREG